jgi:hypothetical protein
MRTTSLLPALAFLAAVPLSQAHAGRIWRASGSACQPGKSDVGKIGYSSRGVANESTSSSAKVYCPLDTDSDMLAGTSNAGVMVTYIDNNSSSSVSCTLYVYDFDGNTILSETQTSSGAQSWQQSFFWSFPTVLWHNALVGCTLPLGTSSSTRSSIRGLQFRGD